MIPIPIGTFSPAHLLSLFCNSTYYLQVYVKYMFAKYVFVTIYGQYKKFALSPNINLFIDIVFIWEYQI